MMSVYMSEFILPHNNFKEEEVFVAPNSNEEEEFSLPHSNPQGTQVNVDSQDSELVLEEDEPEVKNLSLQKQVESVLDTALPDEKETKPEEPLSYENWQARRELNKKPITAKNVQDFKTDLKRLGMRHVRNATEFFLEEIRGFSKDIGFQESALTTPQKRELANKKTEELINKFVKYPIDFKRENVTDEYGRILPALVLF